MVRNIKLNDKLASSSGLSESINQKLIRFYSASQNVNVSEMVDALLVNYDKRFRPNFNGE